MEIQLPKIVTTELLTALRATYGLDWNGIHGFAHWQRVYENGLRLAAETGANPDVVALFAFVHDIKRENEGRDPQHGWRAAEWVLSVHEDLIPLDDTALAQLVYACRYHTNGPPCTEVNDITIQTCWDADRLDLGRVGIIPDPTRLCTAAARDPEILAWALARSQHASEDTHHI